MKTYISSEKMRKTPRLGTQVVLTAALLLTVALLLVASPKARAAPESPIWGRIVVPNPEDVTVKKTAGYEIWQFDTPTVEKQADTLNVLDKAGQVVIKYAVAPDFRAESYQLPVWPAQPGFDVSFSPGDISRMAQWQGSWPQDMIPLLLAMKRPNGQPLIPTTARHEFLQWQKEVYALVEATRKAEQEVDVNEPDKAQKSVASFTYRRYVVLAKSLNRALLLCTDNLRSCRIDETVPLMSDQIPVGPVFAKVKLLPYELWVSNQVDALSPTASSSRLSQVRFLNRMLIERLILAKCTYRAMGATRFAYADVASVVQEKLWGPTRNKEMDLSY